MAINYQLAAGEVATNTGGWTANTGTIPDAVAENDGDTTFVINPGSSANEQLFMAIDDPTFLQDAETINSVRLVVRARRHVSLFTSLVIAMRVGDSGTSASSSGQPLADAYDNYEYSLTTNPDGGAWTKADIQNLQFGVINANSTRIRVTLMFAEINYDNTRIRIEIKPEGGGDYAAIEDAFSAYTTCPNPLIDFVLHRGDCGGGTMTMGATTSDTEYPRIYAAPGHGWAVGSIPSDPDSMARITAGLDIRTEYVRFGRDTSMDEEGEAFFYDVFDAPGENKRFTFDDTNANFRPNGCVVDGLLMRGNPPDADSGMMIRVALGLNSTTLNLKFRNIGIYCTGDPVNFIDDKSIFLVGIDTLVTNGTINISIDNISIYSDAIPSSNNGYIIDRALFFNANGSNVINVDSMKNNIFIVDTATKCIDINTSGSVGTNYNFSGVSNNIFSDQASATQVGGTDNLVVSDAAKVLRSKTNGFMLATTSPARGAGVAVDGITKDALGRTIGSTPDIGCVQYLPHGFRGDSFRPGLTARRTLTTGDRP